MARGSRADGSSSRLSPPDRGPQRRPPPTGGIHQQRSTAVILLVDMITAPEMKPNQIRNPRTDCHLYEKVHFSYKYLQGSFVMAVGGAAYLVSKVIEAARVLAFEDLSLEATYEFEGKDMPVTVAVDTRGSSLHKTEPREWQMKIGKIPVVDAA
jgi:hypothetical protein